MDLGNTSRLIIASGPHWRKEMTKQISKPLVNCICWLSPANQKAHHKHWSVFSAYIVGVALHCALHHAVSSDDIYFFAMHSGLLSCFLCPVPDVSTEPVYSDDQLSRSCSNPYKLYISASNIRQSIFEKNSYWVCQSSNRWSFNSQKFSVL